MCKATSPTIDVTDPVMGSHPNGRWNSLKLLVRSFALMGRIRQEGKSRAFIVILS